MKRTVPVLLALCAALATLAGAAAFAAGPKAAPTESVEGCVRTRTGETLCPPAKTRCAQDRYGEWHCSGRGGDAVLDRHGKPVCGPGRCVRDPYGDAQCSKEADGAAALDRYGKGVCTGGCVPARAELCSALKP